MAKRRIEFTVEENGEEFDCWVDYSSSLQDAAVERAMQEDVGLRTALNQLLVESL